MTPIRLTVTQVRVAASCPRIAYFDAENARRRTASRPTVTRIWTPDFGGVSALGGLFHQAIEKFNGAAEENPRVRRLLESSSTASELSQGLRQLVYEQFVSHERLFRAGGHQQQGFVNALRRYLDELSELLFSGASESLSPAQVLNHVFGDSRRRVDVTFHVGPEGQAVNVYGVLDYVFHDWRSRSTRIIDYKLTPSDSLTNDLFQVSLYALMHHVQHGTEPDIGVLYLHPRRELVEKPWSQVHADRHRLFDFLASLREWVVYDELRGHGLQPPAVTTYCGVCRWQKECVSRLGPKTEGEFLRHWAEAARLAPTESVEPATEAHEPRPTEKPLYADLEDQEEKVGAVGQAAAVPERTQEPPSGVLWVGAAEKAGEVALPLEVLPTHVTVVGAAGSGKTWLGKVLAEEAIRNRVPVIAIDPQGDLVQFLQRSDPASLSARERAVGDEFQRLVETRIFTPGTSHARRICLHPMRLTRAEELRRLDDEDRRAEELEGMLGAVASNLVQLARIGGEEDSQRTFVYQILKKLGGGDSEVELGDIVGALHAPDSIGLEDPDATIKKTERERLARKLNNFLEGPSAALFQGGERLDLSRLVQAEEPGRIPLNVFYLNAMTDDDQKAFFVAALATEIYRWMITSLDAAGGRSNLLFYIDEARDYVPAVGRPPAKDPLIRLFTQGRKYGVCCLLCTQSPRSVDYNVFGNCSTKIVGRLEAAQDVDRVADWFTTTGSAPAWIRQRKGAEKGTFVARWPAMPEDLDGRVFRSRRLFSLHEGAWSPDRLEREMDAGRRQGPNS